MAIITLKDLLGRETPKGENTIQRGARKIVSIDEYRGVVLLPARSSSHPLASRPVWAGPMNAA